MRENGNKTQADAAFRAVLAPHRSLSPRGFLILMAAIGGMSFAAGVVFWTVGAWPVFGFLGLDVLLIYVAFKLNYRAGRAYETIELTRELLAVTRVHPSGRRESFDFNPYWVRVRLLEARDGRTDLQLTARERRLSFGRFLTDDERREFADALKTALVAARGGPRI